jgi:hypothetical protein
MRKRLLWVSAALALVASAALALTLGFAGTGKAASTNTCTALSQTTADCFKVSVDPIFVTSGQTGVVTATFSNTFGNATATHTVISVTLPSNTTALDIRGTGRPATCLLSTLSCDFGNVPNGAKVKVTVQFQNAIGAGGTINASGRLSFAEGNGTNGNDVFILPASAPSVSGTDHGGYCTIEKTKVVRNKVVPLLSATDTTGQSATIENLATLTGVLCTPIAVGVEGAPGDSGLTTNVSIVAFQTTGTVTLLFPLSLTNGKTAANFVLRELSLLNGTTWVPLNRCSDSVPFAAGTDSCISSQTDVTKQGTKYVQDVLTVAGAPPDGHYGG